MDNDKNINAVLPKEFPDEQAEIKSENAENICKDVGTDNSDLNPSRGGDTISASAFLKVNDNNEKMSFFSEEKKTGVEKELKDISEVETVKETSVITEESEPSEKTDAPSKNDKSEEKIDSGLSIDDGDISLIGELITQKKHSDIPTSAQLRTREKNAQNEEISSSKIVLEESVEDKTAFPKTLKFVLATAAIVIVMLSALVLAVNSAYAKTDKARLPDLDMSREAIDEAVLIKTKKSQITAFNDKEKNKDDVEDAIDSAEKGSESEDDAPISRFNITLDFYEHDDIVVSTEKITLSELLDKVGYTLTDSDKPSVEIDFVIAADSVINIDKVEYKTEIVTEAIPYESEVIEIDTIPRGTTNYITYGEAGEKTSTYTIEYLNGEENARYEISEEVTKWPVNEKYEIGVGGTFVGGDGNTYSYSYRRTVPATYYSIEGLTYLGTMADESVIAVDPNCIPLGTKVYVKNSKYDFGVRTAADTGSLVNDWEIDIWISPDNPQLPSFAFTGYHYDMEIYYID